MGKKILMLFVCTMLSASIAWAQTRTVTGTVVDSETGEPIPGAQVKVQGTKMGAIADSKGTFVLKDLPKDAKKVIVSFMGMKTADVAIHDGMTVILIPDSKAMDEVMVVAYGTAKKSSFTGSAATIGSEKLESRPVTNVTKALDGQVAGVNVTSGSGQPGSGSSIVIRGFGSINASNNPLYVVDGVPYAGAISAINPQDIESMTVLKDAAASALYGSRAANGVVIITTKKGKEGRPQVKFHNSVAWSWRAVPRYSTVDQKNFIQLTYEAMRNSYQYKNGLSYEDASNAAIANLGPTLGGVVDPEVYNPFKNYSWSSIIDPATGQIRPDAASAYNEDWMDALYNKGAFRHEHDISINGGSERTKYMLSLGYVNEDGILMNTGFQRYSARGNVDSQVTDWFKAGLNTSLAHYKSQYSQYTGTSTSNVWYTAQFMAPIYPMYVKDVAGNNILDNYGNPQLDYGEQGRPVSTDFNPLGGLTMDRSYSKTDNASIRTYVTFGSDKESYRWAQGLKFTINFGADYQSVTETDMMNKFHGNQKNSGGLIEKYATRTLAYTFNQQLTWNRKFGDHAISVLGAHEFYKHTYQYLTAAKTNIIDGIDELAPASTLFNGDSYSTEHNIESWLARVNYSYADKYYFDASIRTDGSSRFYKNNRWGTFWSVGTNWRISAEEFMKNLTWLNNLSFKISYGENGNEGILSEDGSPNYYAWQNLYSLAYPNGNSIGGFVSTLENKDLSWEKNGMLNIGLEGALLDNRLRFSIEYFNKKTTDMLLNYPMAISTGFTGYAANVGNMRNTGWEFMLAGTILKNKNIVWNMTVLATTQKNKVLKLTSESNQIINGVKIIKEGYDVNTFYTCRSAGVDPLTGAPLYYAYEDMDDNGNVTGEYITSDRNKAATCKYFNGHRTPDLYGSISTNLTLFKCIDLSILTTYSIGGKIYDSKYYSSMENQYAGSTWNENILRRWQNPGDITDVPRVELNASRLLTDNYLINASYFAIKNITLGYTFPKALVNKLHLTGLRLYTSFDNVALFTHLKGMDPQYNLTGGTAYTYTPNKTLSFGLDINF